MPAAPQKKGRHGLSVSHKQASEPHQIDLILQGGGSSCAYQAGYLTRLLEENIVIRTISATSGGAVNGAAIAHAMNSQSTIKQGRARARDNLANIWNSIKKTSFIPALRSYAGMKDIGKLAFQNATQWVLPFTPQEKLITWHPEDPNIPEEILEDAHIFYKSARTIQKTFMPACEDNIIRDIVSSRLPDFSKIRNGSVTRLFANAMDVSHPKHPESRVFHPDEITPDVIAASASLKEIFDPVIIDGIPYRDGGYIENPAIRPVFENSTTPSKLMIALHEPPHELSGLAQIDMNRTMGKYDVMTGEALDEYIDIAKTNTNKTDCHLACYLPPFDHDDSVRLNTEPGYIDHLWQKGYEEADAFMPQFLKALGVRSTIDQALSDIQSYETTQKRLSQAKAPVGALVPA